MQHQALGVTAGSGGVISALLAGGWTGVVLLASLILVLVGALCWVIADPERPGRLALLITSCRSDTLVRAPRSVASGKPKIGSPARPAERKRRR
ncbi:MAG: hypothetical protein QOE51_183 [Actinoplanes sp.]|jgi:hypothetical protein|nr:hypothetical protein [Actinoplanes sp.]